TTSRVSFDVTLTALDAYGHTAVGYLGTVTFSSGDTDPAVVLPAAYNFAAADRGVHTFVKGFVLMTPGDQFLSAVDRAASTVNARSTVKVDPGPTPPPSGGADELSTGSIANGDAVLGGFCGTPMISAVDDLFASIDGQQP